MMIDVDASKLAPLFTPFKLKGMTLRNRFVMPAMQRACCEDGMPTSAFAEYYRRRVDGGAALIISEGSAIDHPSATSQEVVLRLEPAKMPGWKICIDEVTRAGGRFLVQLFHEGAIRKEGKGPYPNSPSLSPSGIFKAGGESGRAATLEELDEIKQAYVRAAMDAKALGAHGVEIHAAHGYLLYQFLWAETNLRTDCYGGPAIEDRARYVEEVIKAVREAVGPEFIISIRLSQFAEVDFDARIVHTPHELERLVRILRGAGVDLFNVSTRVFSRPEWEESDKGLAGWVKSFTDAAVITVGSLGLDHNVAGNWFSSENAEVQFSSLLELVRRLERGDFDLVAVGRSQFADPEWVNKVRTGRFGDIRVFKREMLFELGIDDGYVDELNGIS